MVEIIAEVAQGYEGNPTLARLLAKGAVEAGADAVKFQLVFADELATPDYKYYDLFRSLEMDESVWSEIVEIVRKRGRKIYFDIYGEKSLALASLLGADGLKISTTEFFNHPLVEKALAGAPHVCIAVAGMAMAEIEQFAQRHGLTPESHVCFLYGVQNSPTKLEDSHLLRIKSLKEHFPEFSVGIMDHIDGASDEALIFPLLALPLGIEVIEKHITLDRMLQIEDFVSGLTPERFGRFVQQVRRFETALGSPAMDLTEKELDYRRRTGKVIVARSELQAGTRLEQTHLVMKRTGTCPEGERLHHDLDSVLGRVLKRSAGSNEPITASMIE